MTYETAYQLLQVIFRTYFMVKSNLSQIRYQPNSPLQLSCCQRFLCNSGKLLLVPYTKDFGIITRF